MLDIKYDDIDLPEKVDNILQHDFFIMENVPAMMVKTVVNPVKFSAFTSIFITKGECEVDVNLIRHKIKAPALLNIVPDLIVLPVMVSDDLTASFMVFSNRMYESINTIVKSRGLYHLPPTLPYVEIKDEDVEKFNRFYSDMKRLSNNTASPYAFEAVQFGALAFFYDTAVRYIEDFRGHGDYSTQRRISDQFLRLVRENFRKERFLDYYAAQLGISSKHLSRTVKMQTGTPAVEWITRHVILEAKVMLRSTNLNVQEIADRLSFPSHSFFGRYFKKATGKTPKEYRSGFVNL